MKYMYLLTIFCLLWACRQTDPILEPSVEYCYDDVCSPYLKPDTNLIPIYFPSCPSPFGNAAATGTTYNSYFYNKPSFNPENPNQIAFIRQKIEQGSPREIFVFDFCTGELRKVSPRVFNTVKWGRNNWIYYTSSWECWRVKSNGDSLMRMTIDGKYSELGLQEGANRCLAYRAEGSSLCKPLLEIDSCGKALQKIEGIDYDAFDWGKEKLVYSGNLCDRAGDYALATYGIYTYQNGKIDNIQLFPYIHSGKQRAQGLCWSKPDKEVVYFTGRETKVLDIETKQEKLIKQIGDNNPVLSMDVSPDGKKIIMSRSDRAFTPPCQFDGTAGQLYIMNIDGTESMRIVIPE